MTKSGLLTPLLVLWSLNLAASEVYYITTTCTPIDPSCLGPCLTLSQFAKNSSYLLYPNTTLVFLPGTHYLNTALILLNVHNFVMWSENCSAHIVCVNYSNINFSHSNNIEITNLEFIGCGNQIIGAVEFIIQDTKFIGQENSRTALELIDATAQIVNSTFVSNRRGSHRHCVQFVLLTILVYVLHSLEVQLLPQTVQLTSAKASSKTMEPGSVELYLQRSTATSP